MKKRVVITGLGSVTPVGIGKEEYWNALLRGKSGARKIRFEGCDMDQYGSKIACPVQGFSLSDFLEKSKDLKHLGRTSQLAMAGAKLALDDAGFDLQAIEKGKGRKGYAIKNLDPMKIGIILGVGGENMDLCEKYHQKFLEHRGPKKVSPFALPHIIVSSVTANVSNIFGIQGKSLSVSTACSSSTHAMLEAYMAILMGRETVMVTGGADACITPYAFGCFDRFGAMSRRNEKPEEASRPFDRDRDGFVLGEGAGIITLEELNHALERGAHIYCEMKGFGATADAHHIIAPDPVGDAQARAIRDALEMAGAHPEQIDYINAHGTSTPINDVTETSAIKKALGDYAYRIPISSTKSMVGHLIGGAGGVEVIATALMIERRKIHATINLETPGDGCDLNYVPKQPIEKSIRKAIKISSAFGGYNAAVVLERWRF
jgi:3-oxoacyl-[acyl-carrier-protein] synthase II